MSRDEGRDSQMEFLKVDDFVDGVVGIVWFDGQCLDCVAFQIRSHCVGRWLWGLGWGSIDGLAFVSNGLVIFW